MNRKFPWHCNSSSSLAEFVLKLKYLLHCSYLFTKDVGSKYELSGPF